MYQVIRRDELGYESSITEHRREEEALKRADQLREEYPECDFWVERVPRFYD